MALNITQEQFDSIGLSDRESFIAELTESVMRKNSTLAKFWPEKLFKVLVAYGIDRATIAHGFSRDQDVFLFVSIMFSVGPDFDQNPTLLAGLRDTTLSMDERWEKLSEDSKYTEAWGEADGMEHQENWFVEGRGNIADAYPTTYSEPGFIELYGKVRRERYPELAPGESLP